VTIAEDVLIPVYGEKQVDSERPFKAVLENGVWTVDGTLRCPDGKGGVTTMCVGGTAEVLVSRTDASSGLFVLYAAERQVDDRGSPQQAWEAIAPCPGPETFAIFSRSSVESVDGTIIVKGSATLRRSAFRSKSLTRASTAAKTSVEVRPYRKSARALCAISKFRSRWSGVRM
jgi:hypothetical protein